MKRLVVLVSVVICSLLYLDVLSQSNGGDLYSKGVKCPSQNNGGFISFDEQAVACASNCWYSYHSSVKELAQTCPKDSLCYVEGKHKSFLNEYRQTATACFTECGCNASGFVGYN